jgi:hypothetical protein
MPRRAKKSVSSWPAVTALAVVGGTGLFAAAAAVQRRTVHVMRPKINDTGQDGARIESTPSQRVSRIERDDRRGNYMKNKSDNDGGIVGMPDKDTLLGQMIEKSVQSSGVPFTPAGIQHTRHLIKLHVMQDDNESIWKSSNGEYSALSYYINRKVSEFAATKGIFDKISSASQYA